MPTRTRKPTRVAPDTIRFKVTYPWGSNYVERLRRALPRAGLRTMRDEFVEGTDSPGFFVAADRASIGRGRKLIAAYCAKLESEEVELSDDGPWDQLFADLATEGVYEIVQDWEHLDWEGNEGALRLLGVRLSTREAGQDAEEYEVYECTLRRLHKRATRRSRTRKKRM